MVDIVEQPDVPAAVQEQGQEQADPIGQIIMNNLEESRRIPENDIDVQFVEDQEGHVDPALNHIGFVPTKKNGEVIGKSGVTVGYGVDLGQQGEEGLEKLSVPEELVNKIKPYLGLTKQEAVKKLKQQPLQLREEETDALNKAFLRRDVDAIRESVGEEAWANLPKEARTVMLSLKRNFGKGALSFDTFEALKTGDLREAIRRLRNKEEWSNRILDKRRNREADLLERALRSGGS